MPRELTLILCTLFVIAALNIEHKHFRKASLALWIPTIWLMIIGSRPLSRWFDFTPVVDNFANVQQGSQLDRNVMSLLLVLALITLIKRKLNWEKILIDNLWLIILFGCMAVSIIWSDYPLVSFKRWIKTSGILIMGLVILSEKYPFHALQSVIRRCAYILIPFSLLLIKFFPLFGRIYGRWNGEEMWVGVTTHKNILGQLCAVSAFFIFTFLLHKDAADHKSNKIFLLGADIVVLLMSIFMLKGSDTFSASSILILFIGISVWFFLNKFVKFGKTVVKNILPLFFLAIISCYVLKQFIVPLVAQALGRNPTLTGRSVEIWKPVLEIALQNPLLGVGYGSFWNLNKLSFELEIGQAHNGYLDIFLELGAIGFLVFVLFIINTLKKVQHKYSNNSYWGTVAISYIIVILIYNFSESSFFDTYIGSILFVLIMLLKSPYYCMAGSSAFSHSKSHNVFKIQA